MQLPTSEQQGLCSFYLPTHDHLKVKPASPPPWGRTSVPTNHSALLPPASTCARSFPRPLLKHRRRSLLQDEDIVFIAEKLREAMLEVCPWPHENSCRALMCAWPAAHLPPMCGGCARRGSMCVSPAGREKRAVGAVLRLGVGVAWGGPVPVLCSRSVQTRGEIEGAASERSACVGHQILKSA